MTGYDLKTQYFDGSVGHFWAADQAQIYRTLDKMHHEGWVESELEVQTDRPNRKEYSITPLGQSELVQWLREPQPLANERFPFLVQLYFARHLSHTELLHILHNHRQQHAERLAIYEAVALPPADDPIVEEQLVFGRFTLDFGRRYEQMQIEWLDAVIAEVKARGE